MGSCKAEHGIANCAPTKNPAVIVRGFSSRRIFDSGRNGCEIVSSVPLKDFVPRERLFILRGRRFLRLECTPFPSANSWCSSMWRQRPVLLSIVMLFDAFCERLPLHTATVTPGTTPTWSDPICSRARHMYEDPQSGLHVVLNLRK